MNTPRPHDLLRLSAAATERLPADAPEWTRCALGATPWVVVRRAAAPEGFVAVGVRGTGRADRYGWTIAERDIRETVTPEDLADVDPRAGREVPALRTLGTVRAALGDTGVKWGPAGSVGFELATGMPTATTDSDLDLVIRADHLTAGVLTRLAEARTRFVGLDVRVDCQVETRRGGIALAEVLSASRDVLVKTPLGPSLVERRNAVP